MKRILMFLMVAAFTVGVGRAQSVGVGTSAPNASAQLDITSTSRGLLIPRMTTTAVQAISSPAAGLMVYDTIQNQLLVNMGTASAPNWENIVAKSGWELHGNSVTSGDSVFVGTDSTANYLMFKAGGKFAGWVDQGDICFGTNSFYAQRNIYDAGGFPLTGNTGFGSYVLYNNQGSGESAFGFSALNYNTTGAQNTAFGNVALETNTTGSDNTAVSEALTKNTTGSYNTGVGYGALFGTTQSEYNTAIGYFAGFSYDNGYNNVFLGANCDVNGAGYYNVIAIGQGVICTAPSQARIGNSATNSIGGYADWTNFSDVRYKKNIQEGVKGLDFIMRLRPITYNLDVTGIRNHLGQKAPADAGTQQSITAREGELLSGFAAQEVETAAAASGYDFSGVDKPKNANDFYGLRYGDFVVPLVKAVQEQQQMIIALQQEVAELKQQLKH